MVKKTEIKDESNFFLDDYPIGRNYSLKELEAAREIVTEIHHSQQSEPSSELGKHGTMGYMGMVGCPHQWWDQHCAAYRDAVENFPRSRDLNTICMLADCILASK